MTRWYSILPLSSREQREYEEVLLEELEIQLWFSVTWCRAAEAEIILCRQ
jgi:hypothetical protein